MMRNWIGRTMMNMQSVTLKTFNTLLDEWAKVEYGESSKAEALKKTAYYMAAGLSAKMAKYAWKFGKGALIGLVISNYKDQSLDELKKRIHKIQS